MNFQQACNYLFSLGNEVEAIKLGLRNIECLLEELGRPQRAFPKIQVAGTNGKGSVCAFLESIFRTSGLRTGLYTSPHLNSVTERLQINGKQIARDDFARYASLVRAAAERLMESGTLERRPTFFEHITAIALAAFRDAEIDIAILETGLGGRLDATTAAAAEIAVITAIGLDHQEYLGETIAEIASEKAAIIKEQTRAAVSGKQLPEAEAVIRRRCEQFDLSPVFSCDAESDRYLQTLFPPAGIKSGDISLAGEHQIENARIATLAARSASIVFGFTIPEPDIRNGLLSTRHPGRLEYFGNVLLDGAHNAAGADALAAYLGQCASQPLTLVFGVMKDKDFRGIAERLLPFADAVITVSPDNSRAIDASALADAVRPFAGERPIIAARNAAAALDAARRITPADGLIVVTGSLYLVGEVRELLNNSN